MCDRISRCNGLKQVRSSEKKLITFDVILSLFLCCLLNFKTYSDNGWSENDLCLAQGVIGMFQQEYETTMFIHLLHGDVECSGQWCRVSCCDDWGLLCLGDAWRSRRFSIITTFRLYPMQCFYILALVIWSEGIEQNKNSQLSLICRCSGLCNSLTNLINLALLAHLRY